MTLKRSAISGSSGSSKYEGGSTANRPASPTVGQLYFDTDLGGLLIYNGSGWSTFIAPATVATPTNRQAVDNGANREYVAGSNGSITVNFSRSELGSTPTSYTITASPGGATQTVSSPTATFTGLTAGQTYTFSIVASNSYSSSPAGTASALATTKPSIPSAPTVTGAGTSAIGRLRVIAPAVNSGGKTLTYRAVLADGTTINSASSTIEFTGLTPAQSYSATLYVINDNGEVQASPVSGTASRYTCPNGGTLSSTTCLKTTTYGATASSTTTYVSCSTYHANGYISGTRCVRDFLNKSIGKIVQIDLGCYACTTTTYTCPSGGTLSGSTCTKNEDYAAVIA